MSDNPTVEKKIHIRALSKETYIDKSIEYRIEDLIEFQSEIVKKIDEMLYKLNFKKAMEG